VRTQGRAAEVHRLSNIDGVALESLLARGPVRPVSAQRGGSGSGPARPPGLSGRDPTERSFLALCVALPELGGPALAELDPEVDLTSDVARRAVAYLRAHLRSRTDGLDEHYEAQTVELIGELAVLPRR